MRLRPLSDPLSDADPFPTRDPFPTPFSTPDPFPTPWCQRQRLENCQSSARLTMFAQVFERSKALTQNATTHPRFSSVYGAIADSFVPPTALGGSYPVADACDSNHADSSRAVGYFASPTL